MGRPIVDEIWDNHAVARRDDGRELQHHARRVT
jgi:hypothetical protein